MRRERKPYTFEDNYTEEAYVAPLIDKKGDDEVVVYGEVRFTFKPMGVLDRAKFRSDSDKADEAWYRGRAAMLAERIVRWSIPLPIAAETMLRLVPELFGRLIGIVWGGDSTDIDPAWTESHKSAVQKVADEAAAVGVTPAEAKEAADEKNFVAG